VLAAVIVVWDWISVTPVRTLPRACPTMPCPATAPSSSEEEEPVVAVGWDGDDLRGRRDATHHCGRQVDEQRVERHTQTLPGEP